MPSGLQTFVAAIPVYLYHTSQQGFRRFVNVAVCSDEWLVFHAKLQMCKASD